MRGKTAILLGAGASIDAGLPDAFVLTELIYDKLKTPGYGNQAVIFGYIVAKLRARRVLSGGSPFDKINVEEAYDALFRLINRDRDILSEFVSGWDPILDLMKPRFDETKFINGLIEGFQDQRRSLSSGVISVNTHRLQESSRAISDVLSNGSFLGDPRLVSDIYIDILVSILSNTSEEADYVDDLVDFCVRSSANIATLNYDLVFEASCGRRMIVVEYGLSEWNSRQLTNWRGDGLNLFKLHGSINWTGSPHSIKISDRAPELQRWSRSNAILIFGGQGGKLTPEGPFLQLRNDFERQLMRSDRLLVVGYSFSDIHVNSLLRKWVSTRTRSKMVIVDPGPVDFGNIVFRDSYDSEVRRKTVELCHIMKPAASGMKDAIAECERRFDGSFDTGRGGMLPHILVKRIN